LISHFSPIATWQSVQFKETTDILHRVIQSQQQFFDLMTHTTQHYEQTRNHEISMITNILRDSVLNFLDVRPQIKI